MVEKKRALILWTIFVLTISFWIVCILFILSSLGPYNTTAFKFLNKREAAVLRGFLPEGFGFFTRDPKEEFPLLYAEVGDSLVLLTRANSSLKNFFGILRTQRSAFGEMGMIIREIPEENWSKCASTLSDCILTKSFTVFEISNDKINASICGTFYVTTKKPIPWAWRETFKGEMPQRFVKLIVKCDND